MAITKELPRTIYLGGPFTEVEVVAGEAIEPGMLVEPAAVAGEYDAHDDAAGHAQTAFAVNNSADNRGTVLLHATADEYVDGEQMHVYVGAPGATFWAWLASGEDASYGDYLQSDGTGRFDVFVSGQPVAWALEAVDADAGVATDHAGQHRRIRVECL